MEGIFISYRRDDSAGYAGRLYDRLKAHFGADSVFMDVEEIEPGTDFVEAIEGAVASCQVLIVLIGNEWLNATDSSGRRRLDDPHDFIRLETSAALKRSIRVVPVLVDNAVMPLQQDLPVELHALVRRQAVELNHKQWEATTGNLIKTLEKIVGSDQKRVESAPELKPNSSGKHSNLGWITAALVLVMAFGITLWQWLADDVRQTTPPPPQAGIRFPVAPVVTSQQDKPGTDLAGETKTAEIGASVAPVVAPTAPAIIPSPPTIAALTSTPLKEGASICYRVLEAESLELAPLPGVLENSAEACVTVALESATGLTLTAKGKGGSSQREIVAEPLPVPVAPVVTEKPKPVPPAKPPVISNLTSKQQPTGTALCYQVKHARSVRLTPQPGELSNPVADCIVVTLEEPTSFTLTATGPGGSASSKILISPPAEAVPREVKSSRLPGKGEHWVYQMRGKWPASPKRRIRFNIEQADSAWVTESMVLLEPTPLTGGRRKSDAKHPVFLSWPDVGLEFNPWMGAYLELSANKQWQDFATPAIGSWGDWFSKAEISGREQIRVPAGNFDTWRVEVWSSRRATDGTTMAALEPVRIHFEIWYAPLAKRYVKSIRTLIAADGQELERDQIELISHGVD